MWHQKSFPWVQTATLIVLFILLWHQLSISEVRAPLNVTTKLSSASSILHGGEHTPPQSDRQPSAGNGTLGFGKIYYINMPHRFDRLDAVSLQSFLSGIDIIQYPAVEPQMIKDVGMPPTHTPGVLSDGEKGCWRAHANIWAEVLREKSPPVLILESDAAWDVNVREIMANLNTHFRQFLRDSNAKKIHNPRWEQAPEGQDKSRDNEGPDGDDVWLSDHWDLLSIGQCHENSVNKNVSLKYNDTHVPPGKDFYGERLGAERVVRLSGGIVCTTAYAISQTGAAKLLLRSSVDLNAPVDLLMGAMIQSGDLTVYSVMPPIMAQWQYKSQIGMEQRGANSDIHGADGDDTQTTDAGWPSVKKTGSVWTTKPYHEDTAFEELALQGAWQRIFKSQGSLGMLYGGDAPGDNHG